MRANRLLCLLAVLVVVSASCGRSGSGDTSQEPETGGSTGTSTSDRCTGVDLEATDTGVTADTITVQVMADTGSPLAPGLFQGNVDALRGFESYINANGGLGCRKLKVETWDSKLTPEEAKNGQITACNTALAMVGGNTLFNPDVSAIDTCPDASGQPIGIPDIAALATDVAEQCATNTFSIQTITESCPPGGGSPEGERTFTQFVGHVDYFQTVEPDLRGLFLIAGDLPSGPLGATYTMAAQASVGVDWVGAAKVSGRDEQSAFTPRVQAAAEGGANYVYDASNDTAMISMRREAAAQGLDGVDVWGCSLACYTDKFRAAAADVEGTYTWMQFIPFEEKGSNQELDNYLAAVSTPDSFGAQAWMAAVLFQDAIDQIVDTDGPNAITRATLLDTLNGITSFDAHGWMGPKNPKGGISDCMVMLRVGPDGFERVFPEQEGTLDCRSEYVTHVTLDPAVEVEKLD